MYVPSPCSLLSPIRAAWTGMGTISRLSLGPNSCVPSALAFSSASDGRCQFSADLISRIKTEKMVALYFELRRSLMDEHSVRLARQFDDVPQRVTTSNCRCGPLFMFAALPS